MERQKRRVLAIGVLIAGTAISWIGDAAPALAARPAPPGISESTGAPAPADRRRFDIRQRAADQLTASRGYLGVKIQDVTEEIRKHLNLTSPGGAFVVEVLPDGPGAKAGLKAGDVIFSFNRIRVANAAALLQSVNGSAAGSSALMEISRNGKAFFVTAFLGKAGPAVAAVQTGQADGQQPSAFSRDSFIEEQMRKEAEDKRQQPSAFFRDSFQSGVKDQPTVQQPPSRVEPQPAVKAEPAEKLPPARPETYAVVIGIDYRGREDIPNLKYASEDAKKVYAVLTDPRYGGVPRENARLLLNDKATRNEMIAALRKIRTWDGYAYVYFSGHGAPMTKDDKLVDAFLVPYDVAIADPEILAETSIRLSYLQELVDASQARGVMVALDACFSGGGKSIVAKGAKPLVGVLAATPLLAPKGAGKLILTSSAVNQQSWEDDTELRGGIFSHYLLEGLRGKAADDVWVKGDDLARYVKSHVAGAVMRLKGVDQHPQATGRGDFAVARNWEKAKVMDAGIGKEKLKAAFERGNISVGQLSNAMDELSAGKRSKMLEAFLEGKIDEKKFGELY